MTMAVAVIPDIVGFLSQLAQATMGLLIILDPLGLMPILIALTRQLTEKERRRTITKITYTALVLLLFFTLTGTAVLSIFRISLDDMRIAGGILLLIIALRIVTEGHASTIATGTLGVVPLASPLLVGPGAIAAAVVQVRLYGLLVTIIAVILAFLICAIIFRFTTPVYSVLGESGSDVVARIMGILLAAIAVNYIREGVIGLVVALYP